MKIKDGTHHVLMMLLIAFVIGSGTQSWAKDGKLLVLVSPPETYIFVDGAAIAQGSQYLKLTPGEHKIGLYNYGFRPEVRTVNINPGKTEKLDVTLKVIAEPVSGPLGCITIEGAHHNAILLNGRTPDYFVGHGDEFNHHWGWNQELLVPAGTHELVIVNKGKEVWSGKVEVPANERVVVDAGKGVRKTVPWPEGEKLANAARFKAGTASATVVVAKPTALLSASKPEVNCGESAQLQWSSSDAADLAINGIGDQPPKGEISVQPLHSTTYELTAKGPGGTATANSTVNVNSTIQARLETSRPEIRYKEVGGKVVEQEDAELRWSTTNADKVSISGIGDVPVNGVMPLKSRPQSTSVETVEYRLTATNPCGGNETKTAMLRTIWSSEKGAQIVLRSIYFPTDMPAVKSAGKALLPSQQKSLIEVANAFKQYRETNSAARLTISGHADERGEQSHNQVLSARRVQAVRAFLIEQGIPKDAIEMQAFGEERNLQSDEVKKLLGQNPDMSDQARKQALPNIETLTYAHNRRVDISLSGTDQQSSQFYPFAAEDFTILVSRSRPKGEDRAAEAKSAAGK